MCTVIIMESNSFTAYIVILEFMVMMIMIYDDDKCRITCRKARSNVCVFYLFLYLVFSWNIFLAKGVQWYWYRERPRGGEWHKPSLIADNKLRPRKEHDLNQEIYFWIMLGRVLHSETKRIRCLAQVTTLSTTPEENLMISCWKIANIDYLSIFGSISMFNYGFCLEGPTCCLC